MAATARALGAAASAQDRTGWPSALTIGTASQGGVDFGYGHGLAGFRIEELGIAVSGAVTGGPVQNATLVQMGDHGIGLVTMGPACEAWTGNSELAPGLPHTDRRALLAMDATPFHGIALRWSGIGAVSDLAGRRVNMGPAGGTPGTDWRRFLNRLGIQATISNAGAADAASPRKDGLNDAFLFAAGLPVGALSQLAAEAEVETFGCIEAEPAAILAAPPEVAPFTIPAGTDSVQPEAQQPVAMGNDWVARADMPESLAQEIVKLVLENNDRMVRIHAAARATVIETAAPNNSFLPFHPGAVRCLTERGIEVPEPLRRAEPAGPGGRAGPPARDRTGTSGRP